MYTYKGTSVCFSILRRGGLKARCGAIFAVLLLFGTALLSGTAAAQVPGAPGGLRTIEGDKQLTLLWTAPTSGGAPTSYQYRQRTGTSFVDGWQPASGTLTEHVVTGLLNDTTYTFQVRAANAGGSGNASSTASGVPRPPAPKMYWTDWDKGWIKRSNLDGSVVETIIPNLGGIPYGIAVDAAGGKFYWADRITDKIYRAGLDGTGREVLFDAPTDGLDNPSSLDLDIAAGKIYWADYRTDKIQRGNMDGSGSVEDLITTTHISRLERPDSIALDVAAGKMYFGDNEDDKIYRANLDGSSIEKIFDYDDDNAVEDVSDLALDTANGKLYWSAYSWGDIYRGNMDGSGSITTVVNQAANTGPVGMALDVANNRLYWGNHKDDEEKISAASTAPGSAITDLVTSDILDVLGIALLLKPATPTSVTATSGDKQVTLQWTASMLDAGGSAAGYEYRHKTATTYTRWVDAGTGTSTVVTDLTNGIEYTFQMRALNLLGASPESSTATTTPAEPLVFGERTGTGRTYAVNIPITPLTLPAATGGLGAISYTLQPALPAGLSYDMNARVLSGTPSSATAATRYTYTAVDASDATANPALSFTLAVAPWIAGNLDQPQTGTLSVGTTGYSPFRTGGNRGGYLLNHVVLPSTGSSSIYPAEGNNPGSADDRHPLTAPDATPADGNYTFTPSGPLIVSSNTTYFVAFRSETQSTSVTSASTQTSFGGWNITRRVLYFDQSAGGGSGAWNTDASQVLRFRVAATPLSVFTFGEQTIDNQIYLVNMPIAPLTLPAATGGVGTESYTLSPAVSDMIGGLSFNPQTRELRGRPTMGTAPLTFTYSATDDLRSIRLSFTIAVLADMKLRLRVFLEGPLE